VPLATLAVKWISRDCWSITGIQSFSLQLLQSRPTGNALVNYTGSSRSGSRFLREPVRHLSLTAIRFSSVNTDRGEINEDHDEDYDVDISYGMYFSAGPHAPGDTTAEGETKTKRRRRAILLSKESDLGNWKWDRQHKVHFVCHSQGGNTVRYLIGLMAQGAKELHPGYFSHPGRDDWTLSVTTIATPHRGTTAINALESLLSVCSQTPGCKYRQKTY
jgi:hypothetical protein